MITVARTGTRGIIQIIRQRDEGWLASVSFYGDDRRSSQVVLSSKRIIELFRSLNAPLPVSKKDVHIIEFFSGDASEVEQFGFDFSGGQ
ncbi:MAG: hypothetical protein K2Z81_14215 [Cyanobacteria bacterium]|nr:hypothetical protein [Cyanobacteriota bacterium]